MLLIWGFRARPKTMSEGEFFCAHCGADRHCLLQRIVRWFTFFFIPIFPTGKVYGDQVKCQTCGTCFRPEVLNTPTSASLTTYIRNAVRVAAVATIDAGGPSAGAVSRGIAVNIVQAAGWEDFDDGALSTDLAHVDVRQLPSYLSPLDHGLKEQGKEAFVAQLVRIAVADGPPNERELAVLETVGASLQLSAAHLRGIVASVGATPGTSIDDGAPQ